MKHFIKLITEEINYIKLSDITSVNIESNGEIRIDTNDDASYYISKEDGNPSAEEIVEKIEAYYEEHENKRF